MIPSIQDDKMRSDSERSSIRERSLAVDTATLADVLDEAGFLDQGLSPDIVAASGQRLAGWCYTIAGQMGPYEGTGDERKMKACPNGLLCGQGTSSSPTRTERSSFPRSSSRTSWRRPKP